jgi:hypothetical protein
VPAAAGPQEPDEHAVPALPHNNWLLQTSCRKNQLSVLRIRDVYPGSRILIFTHPGSYPKTAVKERGEKKFVDIPFFVATNFI